MNPRSHFHPLSVMIAALLALGLAGCEDGKKFELPLISELFDRPPADEPTPKPRSEARAASSIVRGTIGEQTLLSSTAPITLRGFGIIVGLNGTGSGDCPTSVRDYLIDFLNKQIAIEGTPRPKMSPAELIDSRDTAVVELSGIVSTGVSKGARFDLHVKALPGTSTTSIAGGLLLPAELRVFDVAQSGQGMFYGAPLAEACGPVMVSPFAESNSAPDSADPRTGVVLGGGRTIEERKFRLTLTQPNYTVARRIERRINERFGQKPPVATAMSRGYVEVGTPPAYRDQPERFQRLVAYLYLESEPAFVARKLNEIEVDARERESDFEPLGFAWEGIGRTAIPSVQQFYAAENALLRLYAASAGLNLGDSSAMPVLAQLAADAPHAVRLLALRELGRTRVPGAVNGLVPQLREPDQEVRIAAYEGLLQHGHPTIVSTQFPFLLDRGQLNFSLDVVACDGPPLIYVRRTRLPRIVIFGKALAVAPPVFYRQAADGLTVHTVDGSDDVQVFMNRGGRLTDPLVVPPRVSELVAALGALPVAEKNGRVKGMALPYSRVVQVLADLSRDGAIGAPIVFEHATMLDLLGPEGLPERAEGESADELFDPGARDSSEDAAPTPDSGQSDSPPPAPDRPDGN